MARKATSDNPVERQKAYAERVDHQYYLQPHPWRTWMRRLSWFFPLFGIAAVAAYSFQQRGQQIYLPGAVSSRHAIFGHRCEECHEQTQGKWGAVNDAKCLACHDAPIHDAHTAHFSGNIQEQLIDGKVVKVNTPSCSSCHGEHKDHRTLRKVTDAACIQCHGDLKRSDGRPPETQRIINFEKQHAEWAVLRENKPDTTPFKFNHAVHVDPARVTWPPDVVSAAKSNVAVLCVQCHEPDQARAYFKPIAFDKHCASCHGMEKFATAIEPVGKVKFSHGTPELVASEIRSAVTSFLIEHGGSPARVAAAAAAPPPGDENDLDDSKPKPVKAVPVDTRTSEQWVHDNYSQILQPLFFPDSLEKTKKSCLKCHIPEGVDPTGLIKISKQKIPTVWLDKSTFNHNAHRALDCISCHTQVPNSQFTSDVLLPGVANCQTCHSQLGGARSDCSECHLYHDRKLLIFHGKRSIQELEQGMGNQPPLTALKPPPESVVEAARKKINAEDDTRRELLKSDWMKWATDRKTQLTTRAEQERARLPAPSADPKVIPATTAPLAPPVVPSDKVETARQKSPAGPPVTCPNCKKVWPGDVKFCGRCGIKFPAN